MRARMKDERVDAEGVAPAQLVGKCCAGVLERVGIGCTEVDEVRRVSDDR